MVNVLSCAWLRCVALLLIWFVGAEGNYVDSFSLNYASDPKDRAFTGSCGAQFVPLPLISYSFVGVEYIKDFSLIPSLGVTVRLTGGHRFDQCGSASTDKPLMRVATRVFTSVQNADNPHTSNADIGTYTADSKFVFNPTTARWFQSESFIRLLVMTCDITKCISGKQNYKARTGILSERLGLEVTVTLTNIIVNDAAGARVQTAVPYRIVVQGSGSWVDRFQRDIHLPVTYSVSIWPLTLFLMPEYCDVALDHRCSIFSDDTAVTRTWSIMKKWASVFSCDGTLGLRHSLVSYDIKRFTVACLAANEDISPNCRSEIEFNPKP